jgi:hydroxymethylpyrimidine/phosphomethylpyrimidine kinase
MPVALTIAGSDSGGGAGIQADLKTFAALGVHGTSAITAVTAQNTVKVSAIHELPVEMIRAQIDAVVEDLAPEAAKTGMLSSPEIIDCVAAAVRDHGITQLVVDPVMVAKGGARLLRADAVEALQVRLLPLAAVLTPNLPEAEVLLGRSLRTLEEQRQAARDLRAMGPRAVVVKGGHGEGDQAVDVFFDGEELVEFTATRLHTHNTHGSGCAFSAAIAAHLARGHSTKHAVEMAKIFITAAIHSALAIGHGHGPVNPMFDVHGPRLRRPTDP